MDIPESINLKVRFTKNGYMAHPESFLELIKPLPSSAGLVIPKNECIISIRQLKAWLKLADTYEPLYITFFPKETGIKNGNTYAQFKSFGYYWRNERNIRPSKYSELIRLDLGE